MSKIRAILKDILHLEVLEITTRNILQPLIFFIVIIELFFLLVMFLGFLFKNSIIAYLSLIFMILLVLVPIIAYFIILKTRPEDLHDEKYLLEKNKLEMSKDDYTIVSEEKSNNLIDIDINKPDDYK